MVGDAAAVMDAALPDLFQSYRPNGHDEAVGRDDGQLNPSWRLMLGHLNRLGAVGITGRREQALRLVRDNGTTYNAHNDHGGDRPWSMSPATFNSRRATRRTRRCCWVMALS